METPAFDRRPFEQLLARLAEAWDAGDAARFAACFTADADYVTFDGTHLRGRAANEQLHQRLFRGVLRGSTMTGAGLTDLRLLAPAVALLHCTGSIRLRWQRRAPQSRQSIQTMVAVLEPDGQWRLAAFQNTRISPPGLLQRLLLRLAGSDE
jgi:uncharacterized protein (TIGR02246 family)